MAGPLVEGSSWPDSTRPREIQEIKYPNLILLVPTDPLLASPVAELKQISEDNGSTGVVPTCPPGKAGRWRRLDSGSAGGGGGTHLAQTLSYFTVRGILSQHIENDRERGK